MLAVPGVEGEMVRTGPGTGEVKVTAVDLGQIQVARLQFGFPAVAEAMGLGDSLILCTMLRADGGTWEGRPLATGQTFAYGPGASHHASDPAGLEFAMAVLPWTAFERAADDLGLDARQALPRQTFAGGPWWSAAASLPFDTPAADAGALDGPALEDRLLDAAVRAVCGSEAPPRGTTTHRWDDADLVAEVIAFLGTNALWQVPMLTLCRAVGVSERRLQYAFQRILKVSPSTYMLYRALQGAHVSLLDAASETTRVADIARAHGFAHLGRFATYYKAMYSELPSATLHRRRVG